MQMKLVFCLKLSTATVSLVIGASYSALISHLLPFSNTETVQPLFVPYYDAFQFTRCSALVSLIGICKAITLQRFLAF